MLENGEVVQVVEDDDFEGVVRRYLYAVLGLCRSTPFLRGSPRGQYSHDLLTLGILIFLQRLILSVSAAVMSLWSLDKLAAGRSRSTVCIALVFLSGFSWHLLV